MFLEPVVVGLDKRGGRHSAGRKNRPEMRLCSEVGRGLAQILPALTSDGPASLLPDGETITRADLFGVLEKASRACDDTTGQPMEEYGVRVGPHLVPPSAPHAPLAEHSLLLAGNAHLSPEFPVILDKGWPPRPRSSSPSSITRLRPIISHTLEGRQQPSACCPGEGSPPPFYLTFSCSSSIRKMAWPSASAWTLPRSPRCWNETQREKRTI